MTDYETDFYEWTQETAEAIKAGRFEHIDLNALADEVESLGKRDRRGVVNRLTVLLTHMLKLDHQSQMATRSWYRTIRAQRTKLAQILDDSPSLRAKLPELLREAYPPAREEASYETGLDISVFPVDCPYAIDKVVDIPTPAATAPPRHRP